MDDVTKDHLLELIAGIWSKPEELTLVHVSCKTTLVAVVEALLQFKEGLQLFGLDENDQQQIKMCKGKVQKTFALFQLKVYKAQICLRMETYDSQKLEPGCNLVLGIGYWSPKLNGKFHRVETLEMEHLMPDIGNNLGRLKVHNFNIAKREIEGEETYDVLAPASETPLPVKLYFTTNLEEKIGKINELLKEVLFDDKPIVILFRFTRSYDKVKMLLKNTHSNVVLIKHNESRLLDIITFLGDLLPKHIVIFDTDMNLLRIVAYYKSRMTGFPVYCYTITHEQSYETSFLKKQKAAEKKNSANFTKTIRRGEDLNYTVIYYDTETTGRARDCSICEIACWAQELNKFECPSVYNQNHRGPNVFYELMVPDRKFSAGASKVNGIKREGKTGLKVRGKVHKHVQSANKAMGKLCEWLEGFSKKVVLVAHFGTGYDHPILIRQMARAGLAERFKNSIYGFSDTMIPLKRTMPKQKLKLTVLGEEFIPGWNMYEGKAHSALFDVWCMLMVFRMQGVLFSPYDFTKKVVFIGKLENDTSVLPAGHKALVDNGVISFDIASKICEVPTQEIIKLSRTSTLQKLTELLHPLVIRISTANEISSKIREYYLNND
ncbi:Oidioi.mRNA.OKI2018_I69.XSR.g14561.t1.cds [Oikopleura dioica]|uniref:Oidioi.mRNA.OKI2018_I69.XSR.g14561.t1.cds n=1 Tax=Oikopleura dioica TaxID=34765 RepID=A0ABN7SA63_OIKDI|nr:Oidioi.mRNA.OKI2018_I69.XSR.g14561.t1.cds [Oikopleura dioica]